MASVEKICADLDFLSDKISNITRTLSLSVLALVWLFIAGGSSAPVLRTAPSHGWLLLSALFVLLSLLFDYLQFAFGYACSKRLLSVAEASKDRQAKYDSKSFLYRARSMSFWVKQAFAVAALVTLLVAVGRAVISS